MGRIGPGALVLVVGPSGAGKDTLIDSTRARYLDRPSVVFPRRIITRAASPTEDHDSVSEIDFECAAGAGAFALAWRAHGLAYAIPATINADIGRGCTVVCNVSRTVVEEGRSRYAHCRVVLVTAPNDILAARLQRRGRSSDGSLQQRLRRAAPTAEDLKPDLVIENTGSVQTGSMKLQCFIDCATSSKSGERLER